MLRVTNFLLFIILFFSIPLFSTQQTKNISTKTAVIFNTLCAKCHEAECSGRLSFDTGSKAASSHIRRYAGDSNISKSETKEFFTLLNYMKKKCAFLMPLDEKWKPENLSQFALSSHKSYFIPFGIIKSGNYHLTIETKEDIHFRVELLSSEFDHFLDHYICPEEKEKNINFKVNEPVNIFLRIHSKKPLHIIKLEIKRDKQTKEYP